VPKPLKLTVGPENELPAWIAQACVVILAVRDDAIRPLAEALARAGAICADQVVLHLSGAQGQEASTPGGVPRCPRIAPPAPNHLASPEHAAERLKVPGRRSRHAPRGAAARRWHKIYGLRPFFRIPPRPSRCSRQRVFASNSFVVEAVARAAAARRLSARGGVAGVCFPRGGDAGET